MNILIILSLLSMWAEKLEEARPRLLELDSMTYSKPVPALIHYDHDNDDDYNFNQNQDDLLQIGTSVDSL